MDFEAFMDSDKLDKGIEQKKRFEENAAINTKWGLKIFKDWLAENDLDVDFEQTKKTLEKNKCSLRSGQLI